MKVIGTEAIKSPLQHSKLSKKGLCDYVINVASGCLHGCTFCYVPSTPAIRTRGKQLQAAGVENPQMDWGQYLLIREDIPELLAAELAKGRSLAKSPAGKGVVMLCSGTDPYQNPTVAKVTGAAVQLLLDHGHRVRILTRGVLVVRAAQAGLLTHPNITVGMSIPTFDDLLSRRMEPGAPSPGRRFNALMEVKKLGARVYVAIAPTVPMMGADDFRWHFDRLLKLDPEVMFWEPINARGTNGLRMKAAGLDFVDSVMSGEDWAANFFRQWEIMEGVADEFGCHDRVHPWPDEGLKKFDTTGRSLPWFNRPTVEQWQ